MPRWTIYGLGVVLVLLLIVAGLFLGLSGGKKGSGGDITSAPELRVPSGPDRHSLLLDPADSRHLFYGNHAGLHESRDGGKTWRAVSGLKDADAMGLAWGDKRLGVVHVAGHEVYFKSVDGGKSFRSGRLSLPGADIHGFASGMSDPRFVYAYVVGHGIYRSEDGATTWRQVVPTSAVKPGPDIMGLAVDPTNPQVLLAATMSSGYFRNKDGGLTWEQGPVRAAMTSLAFAPDDPKTIYAAAPLLGLHRTTDGGKTWQVILKGPVFLVATSPSEPNRAYAVLQDESLKVSTDRGSSWR